MKKLVSMYQKYMFRPILYKSGTLNLKCLWSKYRRKGISDVSIKALVVVMLEKLRLCGSRAILAGRDER